MMSSPYESFGLAEWLIIVGGPLVTGLISIVGTSLTVGSRLGAAQERLTRLREEFDGHVREAGAANARFADSVAKIREGQAEMRAAMVTRADLEHLGSTVQAGMLAISARIDNVFNLQNVQR